MKDAFDMALTVLPCGTGCGVVYRMGGTLEPAEAQREALKHGWEILELEDGSKVMACPRCVKEARG